MNFQSCGFLVFAQVLSCMGSTVLVRNSTELQYALDRAAPGLVITLAPTTYFGHFELAQSGTPGNPIILLGNFYNPPRNGTPAQFAGYGNGTGLTITGSDIRVKGFTVGNYSTGVELKGSRIEVDKLIVVSTVIGVEVDGDSNTVSTTQIKKTKAGLVVNSNFNRLEDNVIESSVNAIVVGKEANYNQLIQNLAVNGTSIVHGSANTLIGTIHKDPLYIGGCKNFKNGQQASDYCEFDVSD